MQQAIIALNLKWDDIGRKNVFLQFALLIAMVSPLILLPVIHSQALQLAALAWTLFIMVFRVGGMWLLQRR